MIIKGPYNILKLVGESYFKYLHTFCGYKKEGTLMGNTLIKGNVRKVFIISGKGFPKTKDCTLSITSGGINV